MPIFDGELISAQINEARARVGRRRGTAPASRAGTCKQLTDAEPRYHQARDQLTLLTKAIPTAEDNFELTWARFLGGGNVTLLEVLDAFQQVKQMRLARPNETFATRRRRPRERRCLGWSNETAQATERAGGVSDAAGHAGRVRVPPAGGRRGHAGQNRA